MTPIYVYDPTIKDSLSKVRGVGRYMQLLQDHIGDKVKFIGNIKQTHSHATLFNPFLDVIKPPPALMRATRKQVAVIHDLIRLKYPEHFPIGIKAKLFFILNIILLSQQDLIITDSEHSKKDIMEILRVSDERIQVVYPILPHVFIENTTPIKPKINIPQQYCIYVGDVTWNKNIINIAKAVKATNLPCIFVGKAFADRNNLDHPEKKELNGFLKEIESNSNFIFPGYITDQELLWLYQHALCNILISRDEGFGFSFLEAASQKTPSILSNTPIFRETAQDNAIFVDAENPEDIAEQIMYVQQHTEMRSKIGIKAYERSKFFSPSYFRTSLLKVLE